MIYFDNSSTTLLKPKTVADAVYNAINNLEYSNPSRGSYDMSINALKAIHKTRLKIANLFNVEPLEVALTPNVTTSINLVLNSLLNKNDHVITTMAEHNSVIRPLNHLKNLGIETSLLPLDEFGEINLNYLDKLLRPNTKAVVITTMSNVSGYRTNISYVYEFCRRNGLILILDAAQSAGLYEMNFKPLNDLVVCFTGHKGLYGPQGTGGIILKGNMSLREVFSGGGGNSLDAHQENFMPNIFEYGTMNVHSNLGLIEGIEYINSMGINNIEKKLFEMTSYLYNELAKNKNVTLYTRLKSTNGPIISFNYKDLSSKTLSELLWNKGEIATRAGLHCVPYYHRSMQTVKRGMCRISLSTFNSSHEIDKFLKILYKI